jgi:hypothetical protein
VRLGPAKQLGHRGLVEARGRQRHDIRIAEEGAEDPGPVVGIDRPGCEDQRERERLDPPRGVGEKPQRRLVCPVRVVDQHQQRSAFGEIRQQPVEPVQHVERDRLLITDRVQQHRRRERRGPRQQPLALRRVCSSDRRLEALAHDPERIVDLQFAPARVEHDRPPRGGELPRRLQKRGLADPRLTLDHQRRTHPSERHVKRLRKAPEFAFSLEQRARALRRIYPGRNRRVEV